MARKVRYCVYSGFYGVLHLHPDESDGQAPFVQVVPDGLLSRCRKLREGTVVLARVGTDGQVKSIERRGGLT